MTNNKNNNSFPNVKRRVVIPQNLLHQNGASKNNNRLDTNNAPPKNSFSYSVEPTVNCMFYAMGIDIKDSGDNLNRKGSFLQVDAFPQMVKVAMKTPHPGEALCDIVCAEVLKGGLLHHDDIPKPIPLIVDREPKMMTEAWRAVGMTPSFYKIAVFVAPRPTFISHA
jgi:hypothetical protein